MLSNYSFNCVVQCALFVPSVAWKSPIGGHQTGLAGGVGQVIDLGACGSQGFSGCF